MQNLYKILVNNIFILNNYQYLFIKLNLNVKLLLIINNKFIINYEKNYLLKK